MTHYVTSHRIAGRQGRETSGGEGHLSRRASRQRRVGRQPGAAVNSSEGLIRCGIRLLVEPRNWRGGQDDTYLPFRRHNWDPQSIPAKKEKI